MHPSGGGYRSLVTSEDGYQLGLTPKCLTDRDGHRPLIHRLHRSLPCRSWEDFCHRSASSSAGERAGLEPWVLGRRRGQCWQRDSIPSIGPWWAATQLRDRRHGLSPHAPRGHGFVRTARVNGRGLTTSAWRDRAASSTFDRLLDLHALPADPVHLHHIPTGHILVCYPRASVRWPGLFFRKIKLVCVLTKIGSQAYKSHVRNAAPTDPWC